MGQVSDLAYPKRSHRKAIKLPQESAKLAEFFGIMLGDGGIGNPWQANITVNTVADAAYVPFLVHLSQDLFSITPRIQHRKTKKATIVSLASTSLVDFLVDRGLPRGNKLKAGLKIPDWILGKKKYMIACVRGLVDTDGCLVSHKHTISGREYSNLYLSFCSASPQLLEQVARIFLDIGLHPHFSSKGREVMLYSIADVEKFLKVVGSSNERILRAYRKWEESRQLSEPGRP